MVYNPILQFQMKHVLMFLFNSSEGDFRKREMNFLIPFTEEKP